MCRAGRTMWRIRCTVLDQEEESYEAVTENLLRLTARIEAVLFVAEKPVSYAALATLFDLPVEQIKASILELEQELAQRGVSVLRVGDSCSLITGAAAAADVERFLGVQLGSKLSAAAIETLSIIAYRQPVTRAAIEAVRGVNADRALATLLGRGLIAEVGRLETVGKPVLFGTTPEFLAYFGLTSLEQLPPLTDEQSERLMQEEPQHDTYS